MCIMHDAQLGFIDNRSTSENKKKLLCVFIDYEQAFDTVIRELLWIK